MTPEYGSRLDVRDMRDIQERLLKEFATFCEANDLRYMLAYGTLLGAIRHGGFIPWDDDVDVMMPRPDYQRLIDLSNELGELFIGARLRYSRGISDKYDLPYAKLFDPSTTLVERKAIREPLGVNIDIFPIDMWPTKRLRRTLRRNYIYTLKYMLGLKTWTPNCPGMFPVFIYRIGQNLLTVIPIGLLIRYLTRVASREALAHADLGGIVVGPYREVLKMTDLLPPALGDFERHEYRIPANPDVVLTVIYGDYMTLPPSENRVSHHDCDVLNMPLEGYLRGLDQ